MTVHSAGDKLQSCLETRSSLFSPRKRNVAEALAKTVAVMTVYVNGSNQCSYTWNWHSVICQLYANKHKYIKAVSDFCPGSYIQAHAFVTSQDKWWHFSKNWPFLLKHVEPRLCIWGYRVSKSGPAWQLSASRRIIYTSLPWKCYRRVCDELSAHPPAHVHCMSMGIY